MSSKSFVFVLVTTIMVTLALCLSLVATAAPQAPGIVQTAAEASFATQVEYPLFADNFESGMRPEWQILAGNWAAVFEGDGNYAMQGTGTADTVHGLVWKETTTASIIIEADILSTDPQGYYVYAGLQWGDTAFFAIPGCCSVNPGYSLWVANNTLYLYLVDPSGNPFTLNSGTILVPLRSDMSYHYEFELHSDGRLVGRIKDGATLLCEITAEDSTYVGGAKHPGLFAHFHGAYGYWDNFSVSSYNPYPPYPRWDINQDGKVDYKDLAILGAHYGEVY